MVEKVVKFRRIHLQLFEAVDQISESMNKFVVLPQRCGQAGGDSSLIDLEPECTESEHHHGEFPKVGGTLSCFTCADSQSENDKHVQHPGDDTEDQETPVESF